MIKIETKYVPCVEIFVGETSIGLFTEGQKWNGLTEIRRASDNAMLVIGDTEGDGFPQILGRMFGSDEKKKTNLVNGSNGLIDEIKKAMDTNKKDEEST